MKLNRKWLLAIALVLSMTMAISGTLAYLTDRDSEANVFTIGNVEIDLSEDFEQGAELIPGVDITKKPIITNTGNNDAWVWATIAIPAALDNDEASKNVVHFNYDKDHVNATEWTWTNNGSWMVQENVEHEGVLYNMYTVLYQTALKKGESTSPVMTKVYMDDHIDINTDGQLYHVEKGVAEKLDWNINTDGNPIIYVSAYAMQTNEFATVQDAYAAYTKQWTTEDGVNNGIEWGTPIDPTKPANGDDPSMTYPAPADAYEVATAEELKTAVAAGYTVIKLADGEYQVDGCGGKTLSLYGSKNAVLKVMNEGEDGCDYGFGSGGAGVGNVTFNGITIDTSANTGNYKGYAYMGGTFNDCTFVGAYSLNNANTFEFNNCDFDFKNGYFWTWGAEKATFNNCTFNGNSKCILAHGYASTEITINNCEFAATEKGYTGSGDNTACVEIDPVNTNTYTINFTGYNTKTEHYSGWTRVKDTSTGHTITGVE